MLGLTSRSGSMSEMGCRLKRSLCACGIGPQPAFIPLLAETEVVVPSQNMDVVGEPVVRYRLNDTLGFRC